MSDHWPSFNQHYLAGGKVAEILSIAQIHEVDFAPGSVPEHHGTRYGWLIFVLDWLRLSRLLLRRNPPLNLKNVLQFASCSHICGIV